MASHATQLPYPVVRMHKNFFFDNDPPHPHKGWSLQAFQDFCREEMLEAGFDLERPFQCRYDPRSGNVTFWQEPVAQDEDEDLVFFYNRN
jgi:hypothetical protein